MCSLEIYLNELNVIGRGTCVRSSSCFQHAPLPFVSYLSSMRKELVSLLTFYLLPLRRAHDECKHQSMVNLHLW